MKRREFIALVGSAAAAWPIAARAQQPTKLPTIGFLGTGSRPSWRSWTDAFVERLRELGWIEGRTVAIEYRWAEGHRNRFAEIAAEYVRLKVDVIVTSGAAGIEVKRATSIIPIVLGVANDPIGDGLVTSLARPGGNVTGLSLQASDIAGKRLGLLQEILPGVRRMAILADVGYPDAVLEMQEAQTTARMASKSSHLKSDRRRISRLLLKLIRVTRMHCSSAAARSLLPTRFALTLWR